MPTSFIRSSSQAAMVSAAILLLSQCIGYQPPPPMATGVSLDSAPSKKRQDTRYLENQVPATPSTPTTPVNGGTTRYETPEDIASTPPDSPQSDTSPSDAPSTSDPTTATETKPETPATTDTAPTPAAQMPFGIPVPGKKGFVYSPYDKSQMVDVRDIPPGKKVRCPYTSKIFLVP